MIRQIVRIDEDKCDGCGLCVPNCHEGAIRIIDGKARLVSDHLCDGLGACLGHCPRGAITIEQRDAAEFDEAAVQAHLAGAAPHAAQAQASPHDRAPAAAAHHGPNGSTQAGGCPSSRAMSWAGPASRGGGCPSARFTTLDRASTPAASASAATSAGIEAGQPASELTHWPVQLRLLSPVAPVLRNADLLLAADCVPFAYPDFHRKLLRGRAVLIACPKLDDPTGYVEKLTAILQHNEPTSLTVAHMEVPCCTGILHLALEARRRSGSAVPILDVVIGRQGEIVARREIPAELPA